MRCELIRWRRVQIDGVPFDFMRPELVLAAIEHWRATEQRRYIAINNPNAVMFCRRDPEMMHAALAAALSLPDGIGIVLAAMLLGHRREHRVRGPDLMPHILNHGRGIGLRHYFFGGGEGVAPALAQRMAREYPGLRVAGTHTPPFGPVSADEDARMVAAINRTGPDVVWVGLGCPKQEKWMLRHAGSIAAAAMIGVGAAFDYHSGLVRLPPNWVRSWGMEWLHRLCRDPLRMAPRNVRGLHFGIRMLWQGGYRCLRGEPSASMRCSGWRYLDLADGSFGGSVALVDRFARRPRQPVAPGRGSASRECLQT